MTELNEAEKDIEGTVENGQDEGASQQQQQQQAATTHQSPPQRVEDEID